ncbi:PAS domain S-box protein [Pollutibacter soli]|uniref:PAS domain-containing sensor histidine kinase n=1 Tax=Pollutibacter soli TaxID=3034157 RepID=UPI003013B0A5
MLIQPESEEQKLRELLMESPGIFLMLRGHDQVIEFANKSMLQTINRKADIIGRPLLEVVPELRGQVFEKLLVKTFETGEPQHGTEEKAMFFRSGEHAENWFTYVLQPIFDTKGNVAGIMAMGFEVTEQVMARKKIEFSEAQYRQLIDGAYDYGIFMTDIKGEIITWNASIGRILGYSSEEFIGKPLELVYSEEDRKAGVPGQDIALALHSGRAESIQWNLRKDGSPFYAESVITLIRNKDGEPTGFTRIFRDITERIRAENAFREFQSASDKQKRLYEAVTGNTPDLIYVFDLDYKFIYANKALLNMWGKTWENAVGFGLLENGYEPWHAEMHEREIDHVAATKEPIRGEVSFPHATLGKRIYDYIFVPVINKHGVVEAVAGTTRDITELKKAEAALKQSSEELEALVAERTRELHRSNEDLQRFAHVASHDLKEPVRKVMTFSARIKDEFGRELPEAAANYLSKIEKAANRMYSMIEGVLQYSSFGAMDTPLENVDLNDLLDNIVSDLEITIQLKNADVEYHHLPVIKASPVLIYQLFYNLINNSLKFSKKGRKLLITIEAELIETPETDYSPGDRQIKVTVKDNGIGFRTEDVNRIFQPFARLNPKDQYEGTGLGLALCKNIVQRYGGSITAHGAPDKGATITILLPMNDEN